MPKAKRGAKRKEIDVAVALAAGAAAADAKAEIRAKTAAGINCQREEWVCAACASAPMQLSCKPIHLAGKKHRKQMMKQGADRSAAKAAAEANPRHTKVSKTYAAQPSPARAAPTTLSLRAVTAPRLLAGAHTCAASSIFCRKRRRLSSGRDGL